MSEVHPPLVEFVLAGEFLTAWESLMGKLSGVAQECSFAAGTRLEVFTSGVRIGTAEWMPELLSSAT